MEGPGGPSSNVDFGDDDDALANSELLTHQEVLKRRSRRLSRLAKCYRDYYWSLMEDMKRKHREYYWKYGVSPFKEEDESKEGENGAIAESLYNNNHNSNGESVSSSGKLGLGFGGSFSQCAIPGCRSKAMAFSSYCHPHILKDDKQKLYKGCQFSLKSTSTGPILCEKPILVSTIPSLCPNHLQKAEKQMIRALKKGGVPVASSTKLASKAHLVVSEYIHLIQTRRKTAANQNTDNTST